MSLSRDDIQDLINENNGRCTHCHQAISIDRYAANQQMANVLATMADHVRLTSSNAVNFNDINLPYRLASQRTKMRLHGLIAKVKRADGTHIRNTWLITKKGWGWLGGDPIEKVVVSYNNQVLGHEGGLVTIKQVSKDMVVVREAVSEPEAAAIEDVRTPAKSQTMRAVFRGFPLAYQDKFVSGQEYELIIDHLVVGKPINMTAPVDHTYRDIAAFMRDWKIINKETAL